MKIGADLAVLDSILDVWSDPVLHTIGNRSTPVNQGYTRAGPVKLERGDGGGVFGADHRYVAIVERVRLLVIMQHLVEILTGHAEHIWYVVVSRRDHDLARVVRPRTPQTVRGEQLEGTILAGNSIYALVLAHIEAIVLGHTA